MKAFTRVAAVASALLLAAMLPAQASATVNNSSIKAAWCWDNPSWLNWKGKGTSIDNPFLGYASYGTTRFCATKYKVNDIDSTADYWAVQIAITSTQKGSDLYSGGPSTLTVASNKSTLSSYYYVTGDKTTTSCKTVDVSVSWYVGISAPFKICGSTTLVDRTSYTSTSGAWTVTDTGKVKQWTATFSQKVAQGAVPTYSGRYTWPYYGWHYPDSTHSGFWYTWSYGASTWTV
ncbi:hypothetical protein [Oryzobacter telluris]|uniref:hypothetical protein n=1 Tax=Oryzobacter telluris TaxID=3149179 RepID=UPI00370D835C